MSDDDKYVNFRQVSGLEMKLSSDTVTQLLQSPIFWELVAIISFLD